MTTRRAFLAGAGALALTPLLPAPAAAKTAGEWTARSVVLDAAWASGGMSAITNTTYHLWMVRTATGALDILATQKGKRAPKGFVKLKKMGQITRETVSETGD